jgi:hypothetical protein
MTTTDVVVVVVVLEDAGLRFESEALDPLILTLALSSDPAAQSRI